MKIDRLILIVVLALALGACKRSTPPQFYMLNPVTPKAVPGNSHVRLRLGLEAIHTPAFTEKSQLMIYDGFNRVQVDELHQWAQSLDKNIKQVIKANLNTFLPGVVIQDAPWSIEFKPDVTLQVDISEFKIDLNGNSSLYADYIFSKEGRIIKKYERLYYLKVPVVTVDTLVSSMNNNLNRLTHDIANNLRNYQ